MTHRFPSVILSGLGTYKPPRVVTNEDLTQIVDTSDEWIRTRTGIAERRLAGPAETASTMGSEAAAKAMKQAGVKPEEIDAVVVGTMTPDMLFPSTACLIQAELGLRAITAFDVVAACSGFIYTLEVGTQLVRSGGYRHVLVVGTEKMSSILDWSDRTTCVLFGDGAGAVVLSARDQPAIGVIDTILRSNGAQPDMLSMPGGGSRQPATEQTVRDRQHFLKMNGREVFKGAVREMGQIATDLLERNDLRPEEIACVIPHQANIRIIESLASRFGLPLERFLINIDRFGNTSAASIPLALEEAIEKNAFRSGDFVLLTAFGAGLTWAASLLRWP